MTETAEKPYYRWTVMSIIMLGSFMAVLDSSIVNFVAKSYSVKGGKSFGSANLLEYVRIPKFDAKNAVHARLASLSQQAHKLAASGDEVKLAAIEAQVDQAAAELWGISDKEFAEIRRSLEELG